MLQSTARKAQLSLELTILITVAFVFMLSFSIILGAKLIESQESYDRDILVRIVQAVHDELILASTLHDGYTRTFYVPTQIGGRDYNISMYNNSTIVAFTKIHDVSRVTTPVLGQLVKGANTLRKNNGTLALN